MGTDIKSLVSSENNEFIDMVEKVMIDEMVNNGEYEVVDCPVKHTFTEGLYAREVFLKAGLRLTSLIHKTDHQFIISQGSVSVWNNGIEEVLTAPYHGVTKSGTRRILLVHSDCIWTTFHPNPNNENVEQIKERIIELHENKLLTSQLNLIP